VHVPVLLHSNSDYFHGELFKRKKQIDSGAITAAFLNAAGFGIYFVNLEGLRWRRGRNMESAIEHLEESVSMRFFFCARDYLRFERCRNSQCCPFAKCQVLFALSNLFCLFALQVQKADGKLDMIAWQIDEFEKAFEDPEDEVGVRFPAFISRDYQITCRTCSFWLYFVKLDSYKKQVYKLSNPERSTINFEFLQLMEDKNYLVNFVNLKFVKEKLTIDLGQPVYFRFTK